MKKNIILLALLLMGALTAQAQYQLLNPGFENWESTAVQGKANHWSSFPQSDGTWAWAARTAQHYHRNGGRPGTTGSSYVTVYSRSVMGVVANGNITTGQVHAGSTNASSSDNYNYTHRNSYAHPFSGTPDSMYVWVSYYAASGTSQGSVRAYVHGDMDFRDPTHCSTPSNYNSYAVALFTRTTTSASTPQWLQQRVPFVHDGTSTANYILMTIATNATPGSGSAGDSLSVDDIEFIYSAWIDSMTLNGNEFVGFQHDVFDYDTTLVSLAELQNAQLDFHTQASDATVTIDTTWLEERSVRYTLHVTAEDTITTRTYTITLTAPAPICHQPSELSANVEGNSAIISWTPGEGNHQWELAYGVDSINYITCNQPAMVLNNLEYDNTYSVSIRAICAEDTYTEWSDPIYFTTDAPQVEDCLSPDSITTEPDISSCQLEWTPNATTIHQVLVMQNSDTIILDTTSLNHYSCQQLQTNTTYIAKVRALCDTNNVGPWVAATFTTIYCNIPLIDNQPLHIYPNPAHESITIHAQQPISQIVIYDQSGRQVLSISHPGNTIDITSLPLGHYTLRATLQDGTMSNARLIKHN